MVSLEGTLTAGRPQGAAPTVSSPQTLVGAAPRGRRSGFTLLELIVVIAVIGILAAIVLPALRDVPKRAREAALKTDLRTFRDVIDQYYGDKGRYPPSLEALVEDGYLRAIPIDPTTRSAETWVLIYEDESTLDGGFGGLGDGDGGFGLGGVGADGEDLGPGIIDVRSGSEGVALDGTPYSEW
jgi:general secretion pathway protein G